MGAAPVADPADPAPGPHEIAERRSDLDAVLADMQGLSEPDRTALWLRAREQMPYEEIAAVLGITVGAAKVKVHRARLRLAESRMRREGARS